jgi:hypothetical protein
MPRLNIKGAAISYQFMVSKGDDLRIEPATPEVFRGSKAPPAPRQTANLRWRLSEEVIQSSRLQQITLTKLRILHLPFSDRAAHLKFLPRLRKHLGLFN